jgi:hypothetical protein
MLKRILSSLVAVAAASGSSAQPTSNTWKVASTPDHALVVRYRAAFPDWVSRRVWSNLVARHYEFEDTLQNAVESAHVGVLAIVITGEGRVEWLYYTPSHEQFMATLNTALNGKPALPLEISLEKDPDWINYTDYAGQGKPK